MKEIDVPETQTDNSEETKADPIEASPETTTTSEDSERGGVEASATVPTPSGPKDKSW
jgi:hypothetical protein